MRVALILSLALAACTTHESETGSSAATVDPSASAVPNAQAAGAAGLRWPVAVASDGRTRLQLTAVYFVAPADAQDGGPRLYVQGQVETADGDLLLADRTPADARVARFAFAEHPRVIESRTIGIDRHGLRDVSIENVDVGHDRRQIDALDVSMDLLQVQAWDEREVTLLSSGEQRRAEIGPYVFNFTSAERSIALVSVQSVSALPRDGDGARSLPNVPFSGRGVVLRADARDAQGAVLRVAGGMGGGLMLFADGLPLAYPVTLKLRVPSRYLVIPVTYRFSDIDLSTAERPR